MSRGIKFVSESLVASSSRQPSLRIPLKSFRPNQIQQISSSSSTHSHRHRSIYTQTALALALSIGLAYTSKRISLEDGQTQPSGQVLIPYSEIQKHKTEEDCWIIIGGNVYDVTEFLENHPGGAGVILQHAGGDATKIFQPLHPPGSLDQLPPSSHLGSVDPTTLPEPTELEPTDEDRRIARAREEMPSADGMMLVQDFEDWGERVLGGTGWNYYRSAADQEKTFHENTNAFSRYYFRPRILRNVAEGSTETEYLGIKSSLPIFISPAAMAKLGDPLGEVNLTRGAGEFGIVQGISSNASCSLEEMFEAKKPDQKLIFQLYLNKDRQASISLIQKVTKLGASAIMFTVDAAYPSKRTMDVRAKSNVAAPIADTKPDGEKDKNKASKSSLGVSKAIGGYQDRNLGWNDIGFIRKYTDLPIVVKGVQSVEDIILCAEAGVEGVVISNHGGRQADYAPAPIDVLYELRTYRPDLFSKMDILIDGGVKSGADVVKALALGAKAVGLGRAFLYANGTHGQEGVERLCEILQEEITNTMRNIGARTIDELKPEMVGPAGPWVGANRPSWLAKP